MISHWLFQLALLAVLLFWLVGAYNRMVRLRTAIISAWEQIVAALVKRSEAMAAVADAVREPLAAEGAIARRYLTWILAFVIWWNFLVGHILNNIRGLFE